MDLSKTEKSRMYVPAEGLTLGRAAEIIGARCVGDNETKITGISTDSRDACEGMLFVAVKGERFDGNDFAAKAISDGCAAALVSRLPDGAEDSGNWLLADDTVKAFGALASYHKRAIDPFTAAVTGSVGKTTTRGYITSVLEEKYKVSAATDNLNSEIGLPVVLLRLKPDDEALVTEMGMQGLGEISYLSRMAEPDIAVITNIGTSHIGLLGSRENIARAKLEIRDGLKRNGVLIVNGSEPLLSGIEGAFRVSDRADDLSADLRIVSYGTDAYGHGVFTLKSREGEEYRDIEIPTLGIHTALDASYAFAVGLLRGMDESDIRRGLMNFRSAAMRQHIFDHGGVKVIEDCYNASPESVSASLGVLKTVSSSSSAAFRPCAVIGDMLELGDRSEELHAITGIRIGESGVKLLIAVGQFAGLLAENAEKNGTAEVYLAKDSEEAGVMMKRYIKAGDAVLVKASRSVGLEKALKVFTGGEE